MTSSDFRQITIKGEAGKADHLFRAAASAFCSLTRPSRRDIAQIEDLAMPLFESVSVEARRYMAAVLCECQYAPASLVRRLSNERIDIAAPVLIRSNVLTDFDLIALIGRHGAGHARAIARRPGLNPAIASLAALIDRTAARPARTVSKPAGTVAPPTAELLPDIGSAGQGNAAETARQRLRSLMSPPDAVGPAVATPATYMHLRSTALTGKRGLFQTALADTLGIGFATAGEILEPFSYASLLAALRTLDLIPEQAFLITAAIYGQQFVQAEAIRLFLARYRELSRESALERLASWNTPPADPIQWKSAEEASDAPAPAGLEATPPVRLTAR